MSDDPKLSERYRGLPREEPPRALDEAILAASRRAVRRRPGWAGPLAAAAVITLAVAVTLHVQHDRPSEEVDAVSPSMKVQEAPPAEAPKPARRAPQPFAAEPAPAPAARETERRNDAAAASAGARMRDERHAGGQIARSAARQTPETALERIADLRRQGRHEEADRELAEFRKRYPDYRLSDEMKAKVEKPQ
jgi:hypothetical protein